MMSLSGERKTLSRAKFSCGQTACSNSFVFVQIYLRYLSANESECANKIEMFSDLVSGKHTQLYRHDLVALHGKQSHRLSLPMNKIPERLIPR